MATAVRRSNTDGITRCGMSRATPEATGRCHRVTTCYVLPQRPPGQHANKQQSINTPKKVVVLMAMAMRRYVTAHIAQWRRSRASLEATGRRRWVSIMSDNINQTWLPLKNSGRNAIQYIVSHIRYQYSENLVADEKVYVNGILFIVTYRLVWAKKVSLAAICLDISSASFGIRIN